MSFLGDQRLCVCGHNEWDHEDLEGGTHECHHTGCDCWQFRDADDYEPQPQSQPREEK